MKEEKNEKLPEFQVEISHPRNKLDISPVEDKIITLEGVAASLPYGSTSGEWGNSGKGWTEQYGTPIGADIKYFSRYEDTFYHLKVDFPVDKIKEYMQRAYAQSEVSMSEESLQEYKILGRNESFNSAQNPYNSFTTLVFGFAPKGMVVVWLRYGIVQIELGKFQAEIIKDDKELEKKFFSKLSVTRAELKQNRFLDISPKEWEDYRIRYSWKPTISSENKNLKRFEMNIIYFNGEAEAILRPWIDNVPLKDRAVPKEINFTWETGANQQFVGRAYFSWEKANEIFRKAGSKGNLEFKVSQDNSSFQILLNGEPLPADSTRVFQTEREFHESYK
ncbi:DUF2931 family protein [Chryseobacterium sp. FH2]|uniref:DUF2931 family protein n=1 Tax=Chryseobacterium sp. FH2 TaxID=1674291 RepID=UPI001E59AD02|nr:DUF2931 family protein [Chryseobacterium sp. FH2]